MYCLCGHPHFRNSGLRVFPVASFLRSEAQNVFRWTRTLSLDVKESFLSGTSGVALETMFEQWKRNPSKVHESWQRYFQNVESGAQDEAAPDLLRPVSLGKDSSTVIPQVSDALLKDAVKMMSLIRSYRVRGHLIARLDPLGLTKNAMPEELNPQNYGFSTTDPNHRVFVSAKFAMMPEEENARMRFGDILERLRNTYCGSIGAEYYHIQDQEERGFISSRLEGDNPYDIAPSARRRIYTYLTVAEEFEKFLAQKYPTSKRFGLEGGESFIPALETCLTELSNLGIEHVVMGMPHRGRLNVLANVLEKPYRVMFNEFQGKFEDENLLGSGDVKYHLGTTADRIMPNGQRMSLSLAANPSHLEFVNPIVEGKTRAKQHFTHDTERKKTVSILVHGDAAFAGQGIVSESLCMSNLKHYTTGGTIHFIVNNQIGFTATPEYSRSGPYPSDVAKAIQAPIFHVNGDDTEAVVYVAKLAAEYRQKFGRDVVVDIVCYRRYGHNELDQPKFTQPIMYDAIEKHPSVLSLYEEKMKKLGLYDSESLGEIRETFNKFLSTEFGKAKEGEPVPEIRASWRSNNWKEWRKMSKMYTGVERGELVRIGELISTIPTHFEAHPGVKRIYAQRKDMMLDGKPIDWGMAEQLAFATLLAEGFTLRLSGQDSERGTFSHRHATVHHQKTGAVYVPLSNISVDQGCFVAANSPLSEAGVLGFEMGFSLEHPALLCLWEAQFGDFANGAQVIIDQFISCGEMKWIRQSGLVMLLPHGFDGQGPEHSSARIERYLQLVNENGYRVPTSEEQSVDEINMQVVHPTTPANLFHVLRRQIHRPLRKPLVVLFSKSLLRHKLCVSSIEDFLPDKSFMRVIPEVQEQNLIQPADVRRVVFCTGQVFYKLLQRRESDQVKDVALVRVEELAPFPFVGIQEQMKKYPNADICWCQEEPQNMGAWHFVEVRLHSLFPGKKITYAGRDPSAAPATGRLNDHNREEEKLLQDALH
uniref:2-oxoglutarate dehydrogenase, mitochondrial n=1 Tax=Stygiella incarcerata TaxID=1712417 RepID=A0A192ZJD9_9EUKA|nr:2-oxoglutarate dehydrogenase E1 component [Stygiella incarcerata]